MVYIASLNDQVVPIYSGLFTAVSHPLILRALYIDGDAYQYVNFMRTSPPFLNVLQLIRLPFKPLGLAVADKEYGSL